LQGEENSTPDGSPTPEETPSGGASPDDGSREVTLTESWTDESGVDHIWTVERTFYYNDYNYVAEASHGDGVRWSADTTHDGVEENLGADAFAADGQYAVFGFTPEVEDDEGSGAHFHAYRRYDGEEVWVVGAPSDGTHKLAAGATVVDDIVVLAVSDYGDGNTGEPLVYGADIETGEVRWQADRSVLSASLIRDVVSYDGDVYVATTEGVKILASDTGTLLQSRDQWYIGTYRLGSLARVHGETLFAGWQDSVDAYPLGGNGVSWSRSGVGRVSTPPAVDNSLAVVGTQEGDVYAFERGSGETRWEASITNAVGAIETTGSHVWVGDSDIGLTAYDRETGSLVHRSTKPVNGDDIAVADDVLLLGGDTATAYTID
jgi:outer membrane protein assembly factor BamB